MRLPRIRISVRTLMMAVALLALLISIGMPVYDRYFVRLYPVVYSAGDLLDSTAPTSPQLLRLGTSLQASTSSDVWWTGERSVTPFFLNNSLIVRQSSGGHRQVVSWFRQQRAKKNLPWPRQNANVVTYQP